MVRTQPRHLLSSLVIRVRFGTATSSCTRIARCDELVCKLQMICSERAYAGRDPTSRNERRSIGRGTTNSEHPRPSRLKEDLNRENTCSCDSQLSRTVDRG